MRDRRAFLIYLLPEELEKSKFSIDADCINEYPNKKRGAKRASPFPLYIIENC